MKLWSRHRHVWKVENRTVLPSMIEQAQAAKLELLEVKGINMAMKTLVLELRCECGAYRIEKVSSP